MLRACLLLSLCLGLVACSTHVPRDRQGRETVDLRTANCRRPFEMTRDCSNELGGRLEVMVGGMPIDVAGSADGRIVMAMAVVRESSANAKALRVMDEFLAAHGIKPLRTIRIEALGLLIGHYFVCDGDAYAALYEQRTAR